MIAKALLIAIRRNPEVNASWDEAAGEIVYKHFVNLGIAAATPRGLIVPNIKDAHLLTLRDVITPFDPIFQRAYGQLDASATVSVTDRFKIGIQAVNLLNSTTKTESAVLDGAGDIRKVPRQWYTTDRRYTIITRFSF